jgi:hypothetical protein
MISSRIAAIAVLAAALSSSSHAVFAAETPLADRAATLGGRVFKVEHAPANGAVFTGRHNVASAENPLTDRAATLGGKAFTIESADGRSYLVGRESDAEADHVFGAPLKDRSETLGGKPFTVENSSRASSYLARF